MSRQAFSVAYTGPAESDEHSIDVEALGPALLAFGKLIREANHQFNGETATAKVMVVSDFEHKCFNINFEVVLTLMEMAWDIFGGSDVIDATQILENLGFWEGIALGSVGTYSLMQYLQWRKGRPVEASVVTKDNTEQGVVEVNVKGDNNTIVVNKNTYELSKNPNALKAARNTFAPLGEDEFDALEIRNDDRNLRSISQEQARDIIASCDKGIEESEDKAPRYETTTVWLTVYSPVYEENADNWRFRLGTETILADISATTIAHDALERGGALVADAYYVKLEIEIPHESDTRRRKKYKVLEVLRFVPGEKGIQGTLDL